MVDHGRPPLPRDEEASADAYRTASAFWRSRGYLHYEVSSYARTEGEKSRHNSAYWRPGATWRGLGLGAASSVNGARFSRPRSMNDYEAWVADGALVPASSPPHGADALEDELLTGLRTAAGIDLKPYLVSTVQIMRRPCAVGHKKRSSWASRSSRATF